MIGIAQLLKSCAENNYIERFVDNIESKVDSNVFGLTSNKTNFTLDDLRSKHHNKHGGHRVRASRQKDDTAEDISLDELIDARHK